MVMGRKFWDKDSFAEDVVEAWTENKSNLIYLVDPIIKCNLYSEVCSGWNIGFPLPDNRILS